VFLTANMVDGEIYRDGSVQKYPLDGADSGPGVLTTVIELAGLQMQREKQQIQVRELPEDKSAAKAYLKLKFPQIAAIDNTKFAITEWVTTVIPDDETLPPPIDTKLERKKGENRTHLPNELIRGTIPEWLQKRVGKVLVDFTVIIANTATEEEKKLLLKLPPDFIVVATNAETKIYKGISSYVAGDQAPEGIAQAYYETLAAGCYFEGSATLIEQDVGATRWHGSVLNLSGGVSEWATMKAPIHAVTWDIQSQKVTISFGPNPDYAIQDFLEYLRLLNKRPHNDITPAERTGNTLGSEDGISAAGDSVGPFDVPETTESNPLIPLSQFEVHSLYDASGSWKCRVKQGYVQPIDQAPGPVMPAPIAPTPDESAENTVSTSLKLGCKVTTDNNDLASSAEIIAHAAPTDEHAQPDPSGNAGTYHYLIAEFEEVSDKLVVAANHHKGGPIIHRPGRNNRGLKVAVQHGPVPDEYTDEFLFYRQGQYVGKSDPADGATQDLLTLITGHPWKAVGVSSTSVYVAAGKILSFRNDAPAGLADYYPHLPVMVSRAGGEVTITGAGWLYAEIYYTPAPHYHDTTPLESGNFIVTWIRQPESVSVIFSADGPADFESEEESVMYVPIAQVNSDGVVIDQILTHNPVITFDYAEGTSSSG